MLLSSQIHSVAGCPAFRNNILDEPSEVSSPKKNVLRALPRCNASSSMYFLDKPSCISALQIIAGHSMIFYEIGGILRLAQVVQEVATDLA